MRKHSDNRSIPIPVEGRKTNISRTPSAPRNVRKQKSFATQSAGASLNSSNSSGRLDMSVERCSSRDILTVSESVTDWKTLFRHLMQPEDVGNLIDQLECDSRNLKVQVACANALENWRRKRGEDATYQHLASSLVASGRRDVAERLRDGIYFAPYSGPQQGNFSANSMSSWLDISSDLSYYTISDNAVTKETYFHNKPRELGKLKEALKNPQTTVISLAGPHKSGKTATLKLLQQELQEEKSFDRTRIITVRSTEQRDFYWLSREIVKQIPQAPRQELDQSSYAEACLIGLLGPYEEIVLILDLSLIALSPNGKTIIDNLLRFRKNEKLAKGLRLVISTLTSLWKTSLFLQDRKSFEEILVQPIEYSDAVKYIRKMNEAFPKQVASTIVRKIDCYPFYLRQIADADINNILVCDGKEEIVRAIESRFEELNELLFHVNVEEVVSTVFDCLSEDKKSLLAQVLVFANFFGLEQAQRIVDHEIDINDSLFNPLCEQGALFLKRDRKKPKVITYLIPKIQGDMLRKIVSKSDQFSKMYHKALSLHQGLYLQLLVLLSNCFMGDAPTKSEELKVLEPFTPSDGVPAHQSLAIKDTNERISRTVAYFREQHDDIMKSLLYCNRSQDNYKAVTEVITQLNVYYFLTYMLCSHESLKVYRKLKREAASQEDQESLAKLNVFIASLCIDANGQNKYLSEANSLYEASAPLLEGSMYAHCIQRMGGNILLESRVCGKSENQWNDGCECISKAKDIFKENGNDKEATKVYVADCSRLFEDISNDFNADNISQIISTCSQVLGCKHPITCSCLMIKGKMHHKRGEFESAEKVFQEIIDAEEELLGPHWHTARAMCHFAITLFEELKCKAEDHEFNLEENKADLITKGSSLAQNIKKMKEAQYTLEAGVKSREEAGMQELPGSKQRKSPRQSRRLVDANGNLAESSCTAVCTCRTTECTGHCKAQTFPKGFTKSKATSVEETVVVYNRKVEYERLPSTSSSGTITSSRCENFEETPKATGKGEDFEIGQIKDLLKKAAKYSLHANGKCSDARECYLKLNEISKWAGRNEEAEKYLRKAKLCSNTT